MSDQRLRGLLRDVSAGEPGARARLLRERLRAGTLDGERARLAAWLGDGDAREALGAAAFDAFAAPLLDLTRAEPATAATEPGELTCRVLALERWGREACVRAAIAAARLALPTLDRVAAVGPAVRAAATEALRAAEAWARCPCDAHAEAGHGPWSAALWEATSSTSPDPRGAVKAAVRVAGWAAQETSPAQVRGALRDEVAPWALGERDPLRVPAGAGPERGQVQRQPGDRDRAYDA